MTPALCPRSGQVVMGCCALPTVSGHSPIEQVADLPPLYEWFGYERRIGPLSVYVYWQSSSIAVSEYSQRNL